MKEYLAEANKAADEVTDDASKTRLLGNLKTI